MHPTTRSHSQLYVCLSVHVYICSPLSDGERGRVRADEVNVPPPLTDKRAMKGNCASYETFMYGCRTRRNLSGLCGGN